MYVLPKHINFVIVILNIQIKKVQKCIFNWLWL